MAALGWPGLSRHRVSAKAAEKRGAATKRMTAEMGRMIAAAAAQFGRDRANALAEQAITASDGTFQSWASVFDQLVAEEVAT